jgi:hypothetical protein
MAAPLHTKHTKQKIDRSDIGERTLAKNKGTFLMRVEKEIWRSNPIQSNPIQVGRVLPI